MNTLDVMLVLDVVNDDILHVNHAVAQHDGLRRTAELAGQPIRDCLWPARPAVRWPEAVHRPGARQDGSAFYSGLVFAARWFGRARWICRPASVTVGAGRRRFIVTLRDVTERHLSTAASRGGKGATRHHPAFHRRSGRHDGQCAAASSLLNGVAEERLTGWTQSRGRRPAVWTEVMRLHTGPWTAALATNCVLEEVSCVTGEHRGVVPSTCTLRSRDGRECSTRSTLTAAPIRASRGRHSSAGWSMVFRDMTSEQRLEEELQKAVETGKRRAGGRRHRARFQQHPHRHPRPHLA